MKKNAMGNGQTQCILCGDEFGLLGASPTHCDDCKNVNTFSIWKKIPTTVEPFLDAEVNVHRILVRGDLIQSVSSSILEINIEHMLAYMFVGV